MCRSLRLGAVLRRAVGVRPDGAAALQAAQGSPPASVAATRQGHAPGRHRTVQEKNGVVGRAVSSFIRSFIRSFVR